ncbi:transcriptional regulator family: Fungal Specific TF [Penicillium vulpinum]|uniref:transcriptional regulator family: Fungal Specific TF n=1 Tax=Penicillium vulpinum TaxID=29845 RepID=UPI002547DADC|nr:transcriptional regulator family: Fungal Specific TF [Penicillium vulpinum]KAJ5965158.1 transcriptional regulator family: Fungal Specific TF [Penicillium vulpinum]
MADQHDCNPYSTVIEDESLHVIPPPTGKKRIPRLSTIEGLCSSLPILDIASELLVNYSKVKCDGERPCTRCQKLEKQCVFFEIPKDPVSEYALVVCNYQPRLTFPRRIESVESEVQYLRRQLDEIHNLLQQSRSQPTPKSQLTHSPSHLRDRQHRVRHESACGSSHYPHSQDHSQEGFPNIPATSSAGYTNGQQYQRSIPGSIPAMSPNETSAQALYASKQIITRPLKRKRSRFEIREDPITDFINKGLITLECAVSYFNTYDRYIPIFDPQYDTFDSIRSRSSILLNAICTIGCMVETRSGGSMSDLLHAELKK